MKISAPLGSPCINEGPMTFEVTECPTPDNIAWTIVRKPDGAPDPEIISLGGGFYSISSSVEGAFIIKGDCCG